MNRKQVVTILIATLLLSVGIASSAWGAPPEFITAAFPLAFTSTSVLPLEPTLHGTVLGVPVTVVCKMETDSGEIATAKTVKKVVNKYTECKVGNNACTTAGQAAGTIVTKAVTGTLGFLVKVPAQVGLELKPEVGAFAEFTCAGLPAASVTGCVIAEVNPLNVPGVKLELLFEENAAKNGPKWVKLEGGPACELAAFGAKAWLMDLKEDLFEKMGEVKT